MRYLIVTGQSGAGKTACVHYLEDQGSFCMDNMPPVILPGIVEAFNAAPIRHPSVTIAMDVRSGEFFDADAVAGMISELRNAGHRIDIIFMEASDDTLLTRYKETRRDHPLTQEGIKGDFSDTEPPIRAEVMSFGFKRGLPRQADIVLDVRFLPNPFYVEELCHHSGLDEDVRAYVMDNPTTVTFMEKWKDLFSFLLPRYREEGKHRLVVAVGCTGGAHRSVAIAEEIGKFFRENDLPTEVNHRDLALEQARWQNPVGDE